MELGFYLVRLYPKRSITSHRFCGSGRLFRLFEVEIDIDSMGFELPLTTTCQELWAGRLVASCDCHHANPNADRLFSLSRDVKLILQNMQNVKLNSA